MHLTLPTRFSAALFIALLFAVTLTRAQTPLGQPTLNEQKVQIWCAAVRFVYDDTGRPNLKSKLNCGGSLKAFENSIKADSQKVYSLLYQPLEGRGAMYKGLGSDKSRLQKLKDEIINKLKSSPSRRADPARLQAVDKLAASLTGYVENGTPPGDVSSSLNAEPTPDTSTDEATAAAPADAGPEDNPNYAAPTPPGSKDGVMSSLFAPIAFILSLLSLVLFWLLRRSIKEVGARTSRYRKELEELKAGGALATTPSGAFSSKRLTPEMRAEIERLVQQRVAQELAQPQGNTAAAQAEDLGTASASEAAYSNRPLASSQFLSQAADSVTPAPAEVAPAEPSVGASAVNQVASAPSAYSPPAAPHLEMPLPAGPPSASPRDEFDSLVPPVQLPAPAAYAAAPTPAVRHVYAQAPANGRFQEYDFQEEPEPDSLYEITFDATKPDTATFQVNPDPSGHANAIQRAEHSLHDACRYPQPAGPVSYIINDEPGTLRRNGDAWQVEQKAVVHFE